MKIIRALLPRTAILASLCASPILMMFASTLAAQTVQFVPTGSMSELREGHAAILLNNGMVLVTGGQGSNEPQDADLYDPTTGTFTPTGSMSVSRFAGTTTLLSNGMVLVTGGSTQTEGATSSAELYDPATGLFSLTGNMTVPRTEHTATLLNNGMVLIAGGVNYGVGLTGETYLSSAELYNPATGTFTATGNMTVSRYGHTSTLLNNGTVLLTGGGIPNPTNTSLPRNTAELYNPAAGTFAATGSMEEGRYEQVATLLNDGKVLVAGGGSSDGSAELYDPVTGTFAWTGYMTIDRAGFTATLLNDGEVLVAGGVSGDFGTQVPTIVNSAELYNPVTETFAATTSMNVARQYQTGTLLSDGQVLIAGGEGNGPFGAVYLSSAELYALPALYLSSVTIGFGNQTTGVASSPQVVTLTNNLPIAMNFTSIAVTGTNAGDFAQTNACGSSLASGASCAVSVTFTPTAVGSRTASVTITDDATGSPQSIGLTGTGLAPAPTVSLSTTSLTFSNQLLGTAGASQQVTLNNTGYAALAITSIAVTGTNSGDFSQSNTCGSSVAAGSSCTIGVSFDPTAVGTRSASVTVTDNASDSPEAISLGGTGVAPSVNLSGITVTFSSQAVGTTSAAQGLTLGNGGTGTLTISSIAITGANASDFSQTNNCGTSVLAGASCNFSISFSPSAAGKRTASLTVTDNATGSPQSVTLTGNAVVPVASVSPSSIPFPNQFVGTSGLPQTVTLMNTGAAPLVIASVTTSPADFGQISSCGNSLAPGSSCAIGVFFDPAASGGRTGTLAITDNASGSPQTVILSGTGEDFSLAPASQASATVTPGQTATYPISVVPSGGFNQSVSFACTGAPAQTTCLVSPSTVALNGTAAVTVNVTVGTAAASRTIFELPANGLPPIAPRRLLLVAMPLFMALLTAMLASSRQRHPRLGYGLALFLLICMGVTMTSCGGSGGSGSGSSGSQGTAAGSYTLAVSATFTSGTTTLTHDTNLSLVVQ